MKKALKNAAAILLCILMALGAGLRYFPESEVYAYTYTDENGFRLEKSNDGALRLIRYNGTDAIVEIPEGVTEIDYFAFLDCSGVLGVIIPTTVTKINVSKSGWDYEDFFRPVFQGCSGLQYIAVREGNPIYDSREDCNAIIESSSNKLLLGCKGTLIPKSVTEIGEFAFKGCSGLSNIKIPESVTEIGQFAFAGCSDLKYITISEGVTSIDRFAFRNCSSLSSITIPESMTSISNDMFNNCSSLSSITIPESVTSIGSGAFYNCSSLSSIRIPKSVTTIGALYVFDGCVSLDRIEVEEGNPVYDSRENCNAIIESESNELMVGSNTTVIPKSVTEIYVDAFVGRGLTSIRIPESVTRIGLWTFNDCASLDRIEVEEGNPVYDSRENCNAIIESESNELIVGCKRTVIPEDVTRIEGNAFYGRGGLTSIRIPKSVTDVELMIPCQTPFTGCINLSRIEVEEGNPVYDSRENCNAIIKSESNEVVVGCKGTVIPKSVTRIGDFAFSGSGLTSLVIPDSVTCIGILAFADNHELISLVIPDSVTEVRDYDQGCICYGCEKVTIYVEDGAAVEGSAVYDHLTRHMQPFRLLSECEQNILTSETIGAMIEENKMQDTVFHTDDGLTVTFKKGTLEQENGNGFYDFGAEMTDEYVLLPDSTFTKEEFAFRIDYNIKGAMPGETQITMPVGTEWSGKKLYYYEILEDGSYSYVGRSTVTAEGNYTIQQQHGGSYVAVTSVPENLGDCDGAEGITTDDALMILKYAVGIEQTGFLMKMADCDGAEGITTDDALIVLKYAVGIEVELK